MRKTDKKVCTTPNYIGHFHILASTDTGCISISAFASFLGIAIGLKTCAIVAWTKKYKSMIKKKKHDK